MHTDKALSKNFVDGLLNWNKHYNKRKMPWKGEKDPYKIWLSEIILQQTKVEQGLKYYHRFVKEFPAIHHLAKAPEQQVYKLWEGLGYYSRCNNLIIAARYVCDELNGIFPARFEDLLQLKGVGSYTASAISSFAYNLPYAVLDGNVFRVLSRIFNVDLPIDTSEGKKFFSQLAQQVLPVNKPAEYNQSIMDFGATICTPVPKCNICFLNSSCKAFLKQKQLSLPVKTKKVKVKERWFNYIIIKKGDKYGIIQRTANDIWQNLYEFVLVETPGKPSQKTLLNSIRLNFKNPIVFSSVKSQRLSHQLIHFCFIQVEVQSNKYDSPFIWATRAGLTSYPFPKTLQQFIKNQLVDNKAIAGRKFAALN
ncbi:MAG: A/G-specific adenine glycosylase [Chitinophagaceae bacterium]